MKTSVQIHNVTSLDLQELQPYRTLRRPMDHIKQGIFVAEGEKVVRRLLASDLSVVSMLLTQQWHEQLFSTGHQTTDIERHSFQSFSIYIAEKKLLESIVGYNLHQGIMAVGKLPAQRTLEETIAKIRQPYFLVALDGLVNAENVGVVVRSCAAFGVDAIIVGETSSSPYLRRAVRNSMGAVFQMPIVHVADLADSLRLLHKQYNVRTIAAHPHEHPTIYKSDLSGNICIVVGNEGEGISPKILDACVEHVAIPMLNETDSLNVASASAVFLYEAVKQRTLTK
jgi:tRNA G18 (ribose-2'-O)-methylase SpoU